METSGIHHESREMQAKVEVAQGNQETVHKITDFRLCIIRPRYGVFKECFESYYSVQCSVAFQGSESRCLCICKKPVLHDDPSMRNEALLDNSGH